MTTARAPAGQFTILYFAAATSFTGRQHDFLPAPLPISKLFNTLEEKYAGMKEKVLGSCAVTVNLEYVDLDEEAEKGEAGLVIGERDEVGIIPPVSSG